MGKHHRPATVVTSNREPMEWLALMTDPLLTQWAIDRYSRQRTNAPSTGGQL
ncbi:MAG: hypothetical protein M3N45_01680 [Actinomycetota bacterium]|nr:hypothetical protein [Actinomycetota bacterium]